MELPDNMAEEGMETEGSATTAAFVNTSSGGATNSTNMTFFPYYPHSLYVAASYIVAYFFIFLLCTVGNILVCLIVLQNRHMRTVTNLFIFNLAISDLLVGIFCIPTTLVDNLITGWPFSNTMCKLSGFVQGVSASASVFTLVAIAVERFGCIVYPLKPKPTVLVAKATIILIWMLAVVIMCPAAVALTVEKVPFHFLVHNDDFNLTYPLYTCYKNFSYPQMTKVYTAVLFAHIYLVPLSLITLMYGRICVKLWSSVVANREPQLANATVQVVGRRGGQQRISKKKIKVIKMLILEALLFMLSWLPLWTLMMMTDYAGLNMDQLDLLSSYIFPFAHWLAFANSSVNPIIYAYYNKNFKRGFQAMCWSRPIGCLLQCHLWRKMARWGRKDRSVGAQCRPTDFREAIGNHNQLVLGPRNRVHNDNNLCDGAEPNRGGMARCVVVHSERSVLEQGVEMAPSRKKSSTGEEMKGVRSGGAFEAWGNQN